MKQGTPSCVQPGSPAHTATASSASSNCPSTAGDQLINGYDINRVENAARENLEQANRHRTDSEALNRMLSPNPPKG
jgi:hypothetical protein